MCREAERVQLQSEMEAARKQTLDNVTDSFSSQLEKERGEWNEKLEAHRLSNMSAQVKSQELEIQVSKLQDQCEQLEDELGNFFFVLFYSSSSFTQKKSYIIF